MLDDIIEEYIALRDEKAARNITHKNELAAIDERMDEITGEITDKMNEIGATNFKTKHGTAFRQVKTRYWPPNLEEFRAFVHEHNALELFEPRIAQGNYKQFVEENPDLNPPVSSTSKYVVVVRRS